MEAHCIAPPVDRDHAIYRYTDQIYKIVQFYSVRVRYGPGPAESQTHHETKLESSLSRARRVILEKALCNPWDWFCTFTISKDKFDRNALDVWWTAFSQWLRDRRKKGYAIRYLLVPERHKDGSWHGHGLLYGIPEDELISFRDMAKRGVKLPKKLRFSQYYNWTAYQDKFGFCSLGRIKDPVACGFYITKYITKDQDQGVTEVGKHSYFGSRGLNGAVKHCDFFGRDPYIDAFLVNKYDFCATGMTHVNDCLDWTFCLENCAFPTMEPLQFGADPADGVVDPAQKEAEDYYEFEQMAFMKCDSWGHPW